MNTASSLGALLLLVAATPSARVSAQANEATPQAAPQPSESTFSAEQLEQIVAPIALHPDSLLTQILMGATYPLEIVEAARWVEKNQKLTGKALEDALKQHDWDPSVKSLCGFPSVLKQMNDNLDWTQDLGDAFLGQKKELLDAVQAMRRKALESGNLKTTEQQKVSDEAQIIVIESSSPEVIYVPTYSPTVVYGPGWYYPYWYYPPLYAPPPPGTGFVAFTLGVAWGAAVWGNCNWGHGDIDIDIDHYNEFNRSTSIDARKNELTKTGGDKGQWKHNPEHRKGVNYKSPQVAQGLGASPGASRVTRDQARGYDRAAAQATQRASGGATAQRPSTAPATRAPAGSATRSSTTPSAQPSSRPSTSSASSRAGGSALSGSRSPSIDRRASSRGATSRGSSGSRGGGRRR